MSEHLGQIFRTLSRRTTAGGAVALLAAVMCLDVVPNAEISMARRAGRTVDSSEVEARWIARAG